MWSDESDSQIESAKLAGTMPPDIHLMSEQTTVLTPHACSTKSASSPDPGHCISAKYLQTVRNFEKLLCLWFVLLHSLYRQLESCI